MNDGLHKQLEANSYRSWFFTPEERQAARDVGRELVWAVIWMGIGALLLLGVMA